MLPASTVLRSFAQLHFSTSTLSARALAALPVWVPMKKDPMK